MPSVGTPAHSSAKGRKRKRKHVPSCVLPTLRSQPCGGNRRGAPAGGGPAGRGHGGRSGHRHQPAARRARSTGQRAQVQGGHASHVVHALHRSAISAACLGTNWLRRMRRSLPSSALPATGVDSCASMTSTSAASTRPSPPRMPARACCRSARWQSARAGLTTKLRLRWACRCPVRGSHTSYLTRNWSFSRVQELPILLRPTSSKARCAAQAARRWRACTPLPPSLPQPTSRPACAPPARPRLWTWAPMSGRTHRATSLARWALPPRPLSCHPALLQRWHVDVPYGAHLPHTGTMLRALPVDAGIKYPRLERPRPPHMLPLHPSHLPPTQPPAAA